MLPVLQLHSRSEGSFIATCPIDRNLRNTRASCGAGFSVIKTLTDPTNRPVYYLLIILPADCPRSLAIIDGKEQVSRDGKRKKSRHRMSDP